MRTDKEFLDLMRTKADPGADEIIERVFRNNQERVLYNYFSLDKNQTAASSVLPSVQAFLLQPPAIPVWIEKDKILQGQRFFKKYALDIMTLLGAMALPYCYAATPGNKAIYYTEKMRKNPGKRLLDTAHFIIEVMKEGSFGPDGNASFEIQKTRLIHALVRHYILSKTPWDMNWGHPVNQEDLAGTNIAFSYIILLGLYQGKYPVSPEEAESFLHTWRFVGYLLHIDEALLPASFAEAAALEQAIKQRHFKHSEEGEILTTDLIKHYKESFPKVAGYFVDSQIRYYVGPEVSRFLGISESPVKDSIVRWINTAKERLNKTFVNPYSYSIMIRNHFKLKRRYS
jgi:hypothetical protein